MLQCPGLVKEFKDAVESGDIITLRRLLEQRFKARSISFPYFETALEIMVRKNNILALEILLKMLNVNIKNTSGQTALHRASELGQIQIISLLVSHGARVNCQDNFQNTPLHSAAINNQVEAIITLLENQAHINARNAYGMTPLIVAAKYGQTRAVEELINKGADPDILDQGSHTADYYQRTGEGAMNDYLRRIYGAGT